MLKLRGIDAKRVIVALANMMGFTKVQRLKIGKYYNLALIKYKNGGARLYLCEVLQYTASSKPICEVEYVICKNGDWLSLLNNLENKVLYNPGHGDVPITCLEELIIKLQLDGWLKPFAYETS